MNWLLHEDDLTEINTFVSLDTGNEVIEFKVLDNTIVSRPPQEEGATPVITLSSLDESILNIRTNKVWSEQIRETFGWKRLTGKRLKTALEDEDNKATIDAIITSKIEV